MERVESLRKKLAANPEDGAATIELAQCYFDMEEFATAKQLLESVVKRQGSAASDVATAKLWIRKCEANLDSDDDDEKDEKKDTSSKPAPAAVPSAAPAKPSGPIVRNEWFQSLSNITFTFYCKGRKKDQVQVSVSGDGLSLEVSIQLDDGQEQYVHRVSPLFAAISPDVKVGTTPMKVEVVVQKAAMAQWASLQAGTQPVVTTKAADTSAPITYPNSKGRDWSKFAVDEKELEEKPEGDQALNKLFQDIYKNATDDTKKAMMKSFSESNGTVLSTNWSEVGAKEVKGEAPKGMETKKYGE